MREHTTSMTPAARGAAGRTEPGAGVTTRAGLLRRVRAEFTEMPGLKLTTSQASRMFGIEPGQTGELLQELTRTGYLVCDRHGAYRRGEHVRAATDAGGWPLRPE